MSIAPNPGIISQGPFIGATGGEDGVQGQVTKPQAGDQSKFLRGDGAWIAGGGGGASSWGAISGTLADQTDLQTALDGKVPVTRTVNGHALTANITLTAADVGASASSYARTFAMMGA